MLCGNQEEVHIPDSSRGRITEQMGLHRLDAIYYDLVESFKPEKKAK